MPTRHVKIGMNRYKIGIWSECPDVEGSTYWYDSFNRDSWWFLQSTPNKKDLIAIRKRLRDYLIGHHHEEFDTLCIYIPDPKVREAIESDFNRFESRFELAETSKFMLDVHNRIYKNPEIKSQMDAQFPTLVFVDKPQDKFPGSNVLTVNNTQT